MARAAYIWVVLNGSSSLPVGVFTVKYEMVKWLKSNFQPDEVRVYRYPDGGRAPRDRRLITSIDVGELFQ